MKQYFVRTNDFQKQFINGQPMSLTSKQIFWMGTRKSLYSLAVAIFSIPFPGLHLILVPLGLCLSIFFFVKNFKNIKQGQTMIALANFSCPYCQNKNEIKNWLLIPETRFSCQSCGQQLVLENE